MSASQSILVVGGDGLIGNALTHHFAQQDVSLIATTRRSGDSSRNRYFLDLRSSHKWSPPHRVDVAILCAAITSLEACRTTPQESWTVNVEGTIHLARQLIQDGAYVVLLSTNLVFDGRRTGYRPDDPVCPQTEYGRQKAEAEKRLLGLDNHVAVIRLTKVIHKNHLLFSTWYDDLMANRVIRPYAGHVFSPVPLGFVVDSLWKIVKRRLRGIFHLSGEIDVSYPEVASCFATRLKRDIHLVQPITILNSGSFVDHVPSHTALDSSRLEKELGVACPKVWKTIESAIDEMGDVSDGFSKKVTQT